jgi:hypothetical protein
VAVTVAVAVAVAETVAVAGAVAGTVDEAVSLPVYSVQQAQGIAVEYERFHLLPAPWSVAVGVDVRDAADGDYGSTAVSVSGEARYWFRRRAMTGWFLGAGLALTHSTITDRVDDRRVGETLAVGIAAQAGYRFVPWRTLEITPSLGIERRREFDLDGRLPAWSHGSITTGLTIGWMF